MGQNISIHAGSERTSRRVPRLSDLTAQREQRSSAEQDQEEGEQSLLTPTGSRSASDVLLRLPSMATFRRQTHAIPRAREQNSAEEGTSSRGEVILEQEERPLVSMEDLRIPDAPITDIRASPMPRRSSVWRLSSRHSRRFSAMEPMDSQGSPGDILIQQSLSDDVRGPVSEPPRRHRHSMHYPLPGIFGSHTPRPSERRRLAPISRPIPISEDLASHYDIITAAREAPTPGQTQSVSGIDSPHPSTQTRQSRLSRVRRSLSSPFGSVFGSSQRSRMREPQDHTTDQSSLLDRTDEVTPNEMEYLLPPVSLADPIIDLGGPNTDTTAPTEDRSHPVSSLPGLPEVTERPRSWAQRLTDRTPTPRREGRTGINLLRGRSSRIIRRDDEAPLSRILQLAAAAIAAQLSGSADALTNLESMGDDHFDGGLNNFVEELNTATSSGNNPASDNPPAAANATPLNFWRVFRFVSPSDEASARAPESDASDPRTVTLVVVGVRSVPSSSIQREGSGEHNLDSLLGSPSVRPGPGSLLRSLNRARLGRRSSIASSTPFPQQYDSQRHSRIRPLSSIPTAASGPDTNSTPISAASESLQRSRTISSPMHGRSYSENSTPTAHQSSPHASQMSPVNNSEGQTESNTRRRSYRSRSPPPLDGDSQSDSAVRQRRRSASESARHRNLGAGASRRNGTIDPDGGPVQGRSWLIYVVGTNLPEDHPAFTTPSLFTDNPSYEDMLLLSNILGPVKPPVASSDDVAASGGTYRIVLREADGSLRASAVDDDSELVIVSTDSCQVCLESYAPEQLIRKLNRCAHMFHQECVDEWLTTGRNSCPLCRGQGVKEVARET